MSSLKLISINIERDKHLDLVLPFIREQKPDVVCIQEIRDTDIPKFTDIFPSEHIFSPTMRHLSDGYASRVGQAIFSRIPVHTSALKYYVGGPGDVPHEELPHQQGNRALVVCEVGNDAERFRIGNVHFTWTPDGRADDAQRRDVRALLAVLETLDEIVFCGDFNAPRGGEIFSLIAARYTDTIPQHYQTSIDMNLHRAARVRPEELADKMVDGLFTTPGYQASGVRLQFGVSDHAAIVAQIAKSK